MSNMLPPLLAHFLNHAQLQRRDIASSLCTKSCRGEGDKQQIERGKHSIFCRRSKFLFAPILLHFQLTVLAFFTLSLDHLLLFDAITAATYSTTEGVSILPFAEYQRSYSLPFFSTFNSLFQPSILFFEEATAKRRMFSERRKPLKERGVSNSLNESQFFFISYLSTVRTHCLHRHYSFFPVSVATAEEIIRNHGSYRIKDNRKRSLQPSSVSLFFLEQKRQFSWIKPRRRKPHVFYKQSARS